MSNRGVQPSNHNISVTELECRKFIYFFLSISLKIVQICNLKGIQMKKSACTYCLCYSLQIMGVQVLLEVMLLGSTASGSRQKGPLAVSNATSSDGADSSAAVGGSEIVTFVKLFC